MVFRATGQLPGLLSTRNSPSTATFPPSMTPGGDLAPDALITSSKSADNDVATNAFVEGISTPVNGIEVEAGCQMVDLGVSHSQVADRDLREPIGLYDQLILYTGRVGKSMSSDLSEFADIYFHFCQVYPASFWNRQRLADSVS